MDEDSTRQGGRYVPAHPNDQQSTAVLVSVMLGLVVATLFAHGIQRGELVDADQVRHLPVHYALDINSAVWPEWILLPGIGEILARRIVASRQNAGSFQSREDLLRVKGIGPRTLEKIRKWLVVASH